MFIHLECVRHIYKQGMKQQIYYLTFKMYQGECIKQVLY